MISVVVVVFMSYTTLSNASILFQLLVSIIFTCLLCLQHYFLWLSLGSKQQLLVVLQFQFLLKLLQLFQSSLMVQRPSYLFLLLQHLATTLVNYCFQLTHDRLLEFAWLGYLESIFWLVRLPTFQGPKPRSQLAKEPKLEQQPSCPSWPSWSVPLS